MKNKFLFYPYIALLMVAIGSFVTACDGDDEEPIIAPSVTMERIMTTDSNELTIVFTPSESTAGFKYAIGDETDRQAFIQGQLSGIKECEGNGKQTIVFQGLSENEVYTVFACAYNQEGATGPIASIKAKTRNTIEEFPVTKQYVTDHSAAFTLKATSDYFRFAFALGKPGDKKIFEAGVIEGYETKENISEYTANYFDLDANTKYVFYARGFDRLSGIASETQEYAFTTDASGNIPAADLKINYMDMYSGDYTLTPNAYCGKCIVFFSLKDEYKDMIEEELNWRGDMVTMMERWTELNTGMTYKSVGDPLNVTYTTPTLLTTEISNPFGYPLEAYALLYKKDGEVYGIQKFSFSTPPYQEKMGMPKVELKISNITETGAFYEFTPNEYTMGVLMQTFDAEWYEKLLQSSDYYDNYIRDFLYMNGYWNYCHNVSSFTLPERSAEPGKRCYVFYLPMNYNGPGDGWGEVGQMMYTTLEKKD